MSDLFLFIQQGWKIIWKQKLIFVFSVYSLSGQLFNIIQVIPNWRSVDSILYLFGIFLIIILVFAGYIGVPYLAYCSSIENFITYQEALAGIRKFAWRVLGCSCLGLIALTPFFFWVLSASIDRVHRTLQFSDKTILGSFLLSAFTSLYYFSLAGIFANDQGVFKSVQEAWKQFTNHFVVLALLGILISIVFRASYTIAGILTLLFQSGFDLSALTKLNFLNPFATLGKNVLFILLNSIGQAILTPLQAAIFISAYLQYSEIKTSLKAKKKFSTSLR